jgi:hypothetical protein
LSCGSLFSAREKLSQVAEKLFLSCGMSFSEDRMLILAPGKLCSGPGKLYSCRKKLFPALKKLTPRPYRLFPPPYKLGFRP